MPTDSDLDPLRTLTVKQLRQRWGEERCKGDPPRFKHALVQGIAGRIQERSCPGLDAETRRLLNAAIRSAPLPERKRKQAKRNHRERLALSPGSTLLREWSGMTHEVQALPDSRFRYRGDEYSSLSEIAREITGARWSGPRFFGLKKARQ